MKLSYIYLFVYLLIIIGGLFFNSRHTFKTSLSIIFSFLVVSLSLYLDQILKSKILYNLTYGFNGLLSGVYSYLKVYSNQTILLSQTLVIFIYFSLLFIFFSILCTYIKYNVSSKDNVFSFKKILSFVIYTITVGITFTYFFANLTPLFKIEIGVFQPMVESLEVLFI